MTSRERSATRAGYVVLLGAANVGKSTLLNRILGEKVTITLKLQAALVQA